MSETQAHLKVAHGAMSQGRHQRGGGGGEVRLLYGRTRFVPERRDRGRGEPGPAAVHRSFTRPRGSGARRLRDAPPQNMALGIQTTLS